ncbi:MAG: hypothetical protein L0Z53_25090 [Acidobacteriales bacterium]|nr:hypothetical protein [Terriglobales bacterium]
MGSTALIQTLRDTFSNYSGVKTLFAEPIETQGKTVIPVAQVSYAFGAGSGSRSEDQATGGGGGGALNAAPVGVVEITPLATRFIPITPGRKLLGAAAAGLVFGMWIGRRRAAKKH